MKVACVSGGGSQVMGDLEDPSRGSVPLNEWELIGSC